MKAFMDYEEHKTMKEKRNKKISGEKRKDYYDDVDLMSLGKKKNNVKNKINSVNKDASYKNNYKKFQYDYEEDLYDPDYRY